MARRCAACRLLCHAYLNYFWPLASGHATATATATATVVELLTSQGRLVPGTRGFWPRHVSNVQLFLNSSSTSTHRPHPLPRSSPRSAYLPAPCFPSCVSRFRDHVPRQAATPWRHPTLRSYLQATSPVACSNSHDSFFSEFISINVLRSRQVAYPDIICATLAWCKSCSTVAPTASATFACSLFCQMQDSPGNHPRMKATTAGISARPT